jgi:predicted transcriptional regulator
MGDRDDNILIPVSPGELVDRLTILEIKSQHIADAAKRANVAHELALLSAAAKAAIPDSEEMRAFRGEIKAVNETLWQIEDDIRECERRGDFGDIFIGLARSVYRTNDLRAELKRRINEALGSAIRDEKSYTPY